MKMIEFFEEHYAASLIIIFLLWFVVYHVRHAQEIDYDDDDY